MRTSPSPPLRTSPDAPPVVIDAGSVRAVVLDADGVLTDSRPLRTAAWKDALSAYQAQYTRVTGHAQRPAHGLPPELLGRLDEDTAVGLLHACGDRIDLAAAHLGPSEEQLLDLLVRLEEDRFQELLRSAGAPARSGAARLLRDLRVARIATAAVSTGRSGTELLTPVGLARLIDTIVDARDARENRLEGPPSPALYQLALRLCHTAPEHAVLVIDTPAALEAGRRAGFGRIIAVTRGDGTWPVGGATPVDGTDRLTVRR